MKLRAFFGAITPFLEGRASHDETSRALYGSPEGGTRASDKDARRLAIYGRFCRIHRFEIPFRRDREARFQNVDTQIH